MKILVVAFVILVSSNVVAAEKGKFVPTKDLPATIKNPSKTTTTDPKFAGIPSCSVGRVVLKDHDSEPMLTWREANQNHKCYDAKEVYACRAFGKLSVRCE